MSVVGAVSDALLALGVALIGCCCVGMALLRDAMDRLHLLTPATTLGVAAVVAGVVVRHGLDATGLSAIGVAAVAIGTGPFVTHALARSVHVRRGEERP